MRIKPLIMKVIRPALESEGFELVEDKYEYVFSKPDKSQVISFDTEKYQPKKLRATFFVHKPHMFLFYYSLLDPGFCPSARSTYTTQQELDVYVAQMTQAIQEIILPYMNIMAENMVEKTCSMEQKLAQNTAERGERFSKRWELNMNCEDRSNLYKLEDIIRQFQTEIQYRRRDFFAHEEELIDMAAYFGGLHSLKVSDDPYANWYWRTVSETPFYADARGYDILDRVLAAWNCGREVINCGFRHFPMN